MFDPFFCYINIVFLREMKKDYISYLSIYMNRIMASSYLEFYVCCVENLLNEVNI